jgi:hypothetical protein
MRGLTFHRCLRCTLYCIGAIFSSIKHVLLKSQLRKQSKYYEEIHRTVLKVMYLLLTIHGCLPKSTRYTKPVEKEYEEEEQGEELGKGRCLPLLVSVLVLDLLY